MKNYTETKTIKDLAKVLGLPKAEAARVEMRADLAVAIKKAIEKRSLTHASAAKQAEVGRTVITAIKTDPKGMTNWLRRLLEKPACLSSSLCWVKFINFGLSPCSSQYKWSGEILRGHYSVQNQVLDGRFHDSLSSEISEASI